MSYRTFTALAAAAALGVPAAVLAAPASAAPTPADAPAAHAAAASATPAHQAARHRSWARATLRSTSGNAIGTVWFRSVQGGTEVRIKAKYVKPGWHGFHVHAIGKCERTSADPMDASKVGAFLSSGGHFAKGDQAHPDHAGDLPLVLAQKNTRVSLTTVTDRFTVRDLFDKNGSAVMLHSGADNYANIPERYDPAPDAETKKAGDSGSRVACGVVR